MQYWTKIDEFVNPEGLFYHVQKGKFGETSHFFRSYFRGRVLASETLGFFKSELPFFLEGLLADASSWFSRVVFTKEFNPVKTYFLKHPPT